MRVTMGVLYVVFSILTRNKKYSNINTKQVQFKKSWKGGSDSTELISEDASSSPSSTSQKGRPRRSSRYGLDVIEESDVVEEGPFLPVDETEEHLGVVSHRVVMRLYVVFF